MSVQPPSSRMTRRRSSIRPPARASARPRPTDQSEFFPYGIQRLIDLATGRAESAEEVALDNLADLDKIMDTDADQAEGPAIGFVDEQGFGGLEHLFSHEVEPRESEPSQSGPSRNLRIQIRPGAQGSVLSAQLDPETRVLSARVQGAGSTGPASSPITMGIPLSCAADRGHRRGTSDPGAKRNRTSGDRESARVARHCTASPPPPTPYDVFPLSLLAAEFDSDLETNQNTVGLRNISRAFINPRVET